MSPVAQTLLSACSLASDTLQPNGLDQELRISRKFQL
jgi:hypothetical protein